MPNIPNAQRRACTYVVVRWVRDVFSDRPADEVKALGTVRAGSRAEARARACAAWPGEPTAALRVRRASACRPALLLLEALTADGARSLGRVVPTSNKS